MLDFLKRNPRKRDSIIKDIKTNIITNFFITIIIVLISAENNILFIIKEGAKHRTLQAIIIGFTLLRANNKAVFDYLAKEY